MTTSEYWPSRSTSSASHEGVATKSSVVRLEWIDALRGIAILMVILIHVGTSTHGLQHSIKNFTDYGSRGVELFFIVSSFTLFRSASKKFNARSFYIRRFARIAPMFFLALIFYAIVGYFGWYPFIKLGHRLSYAVGPRNARQTAEWLQQQAPYGKLHVETI